MSSYTRHWFAYNTSEVDLYHVLHVVISSFTLREHGWFYNADIRVEFAGPLALGLLDPQL